MSRDNMNMNMNMNMGVGIASTSVAPSRVRFNTADYRKLTQGVGNIGIWPLPAFPANWDPDLRSYVYLNEFVVRNVGWEAALSAALGPSPVANQATLEAQLRLMLDLAPDREDRFAEIIDQHDAEGCISYFLGMLAIDPARNPMTYLLVRTARRIGEHVVMVLKAANLVARPSQTCPALVPMIDPPVTPSFPAGHSLQARLMARCLQAARPGAFRATMLDYLADRIGKNRIIAGLHYPLDHAAGVNVADALFNMLNNAANAPRFVALLGAARAE